MKAQGLARIGRDAEVRYLPNGDAVTSVSLAFTFGKKDQDGKRPTQWVDGSLWGKRGETLAQYLVKGSQVVAYLEDVHIQTYETANGPGHKLVAKIADVELVAGQQQRQRQQQPQQRQAPQQRQHSTSGGNGGFDDMDDDIPFRDPMANRAFALSI